MFTCYRVNNNIIIVFVHIQKTSLLIGKHDIVLFGMFNKNV